MFEKENENKNNSCELKEEEDDKLNFLYDNSRLKPWYKVVFNNSQISMWGRIPFINPVPLIWRVYVDDV